MKILLDTHIFLWAITKDQRFKSSQRDHYLSGANELYLSVASIWEMLIKVSSGKLPLKLPAAPYIEAQMVANRIQTLPIHFTHLAELESLPPIHRDPFDRMLIAQSRAEKMPILSSDSAFRQYDVAIL